MRTPIVQLQQFVEAVRDAGYRGTGAALSELVDNAFEAGARNVRIEIALDAGDKDCVQSIAVTDDGCGMSAPVMEAALQFGGSSRFGSRRGSGRFGMGLPNSSVSQARRVDVYSWQGRETPLWSYLDLDDIAAGLCKTIPEPRKRQLPDGRAALSVSRGTVVVWTKCDRLNPRRYCLLQQRLHKELGRTFRCALWGGRRIMINGERVRPYDPLFLREGTNLLGGRQYGPDMEYLFKVGAATRGSTVSTVLVRFAELPIEEWHRLSNQEKRQRGISKNAGVSILRAGREIDYGWYFMGEKRKENYDDWWRCQIEFQPDLDDLFGVTHIKQGINPSEHLTALLTPDLEQVAHNLNYNARARFMKLKPDRTAPSERIASEKDAQFEPPAEVNVPSTGAGRMGRAHAMPRQSPSTFRLSGLRYRLVVKDLPCREFFSSELDGGRLIVTLNRQHPFFERMCGPLVDRADADVSALRRQVELLVLAAARAEAGLGSRSARRGFKRYLLAWSDLLAAFLA